MPRVKRTRKEREGFLIREFLAALDYRVSSPKWTESPDAFVTVSRRGRGQRVGIEHTDYFNDTVAGQGSPLTPVAEFWDLVETSLVRRISHRKHLTGLDGSVRLQPTFRPPMKDSPACPALAKQLAEALVDLAENHPIEIFKHQRFNRPDFQKHPALKSMAASVRLTRIAEPSKFMSRCSWSCSNISTGAMALSVDYVTSAVQKKNCKAPNYNRNGAQELWLVITAAGDTVSNHAGPFSESAKLDDSQLKTLCQDSPFDRIVFWERIRRWYKWLKPDISAKQYRDL